MKGYVIYVVGWLFYFIGWWFIYKRQLAEKSVGLLLTIFLVVGVFFPAAAIYLTHDIAMVAYVKDKYCHENMVEIKETVEYPGSVYWEDNVFPAFDPLSRRWMVEHYLDGTHLHALALNGDDGKIYLYRAEAGQFAESKRLLDEMGSLEKQAGESIEAGKVAHDEQEKTALIAKGTSLRKQAGEFSAQRRVIHDKAVLAVIAKEEVFISPADLPPLNYKVAFNQEPLPAWQEDYIYSDKIQIIDQRTRKIIAWSKRVERYKYTLEVDLVGGKLLFETIAGNSKMAYFDGKILFPYINPPRGWFGRTDDVKRVYKRDIEGLYHGR